MVCSVAKKPDKSGGKRRFGKSKKNDGKMVQGAANELKMTKDQRRDFGKFIEAEKAALGRGGAHNFTYQELLELGREFLGN